jgi:hypothetical protein
MLRLKVQLESAIEPLTYESLKWPLNIFAKNHPREAEKNDVTSAAFRRALATQAAKYMAKHRGSVSWRGVIDNGLAKEVVIEIARMSNGSYESDAYITSIHIELIPRLAGKTTG